ncbi:MAG: hypothetical protein KC656_07765 [Myxococcales bacterium]|nr:hypothetical protein [Myxococcales bacterium]MCB9669238.1 hypothetical protein [Alphaproteobacteria bacterium]
MLIDDLKATLAGAPPPVLDLPPIEAPPLHDLIVVVPALPPEREVDEARLLELYEARIRETAPRRRRETGEFAKAGDEVLVTMAFFHEGKALAFTAVDRELLVAGEPWSVPGVGEGLIGATYEELSSIRTTFPEDHEAAWLRGVTGTWRARILEIDVVSEPDWEAPDLLAQHGIDLSLDDFMVALREEEIANMALELKNQAVEITLDLLRKRAPYTVPREAVEREIYTRWAGHEGRVLLELGAGESDLNLSFAAWLRDEATFADCERRVHVAVILAAIAERDGVTLSREALQDALDTAAAMTGATPEAIKADLKDDPAGRAAFEQDAYHIQLVDHVLSHARIRYLEG